MRKFFFIISFFIYFPSSASLNNFNIVGCWVGIIKIYSQEISIKVCFEEDSLLGLRGNIDIPQQNAFDLKLDQIKINNDSCAFQLVISPLNIAQFRGRVFYERTDSAKILGTFSQMGIFGFFELVNYCNEKPEETTQVSFHEEEIQVDCNKVMLGGTFSRPPELKKYPVVIFISGSGPQNRDEEIFGFKIFRKISDFLVLNGFATLRMDDRGVGLSTDIPKEGSSTLDYSNDVLYLINYLKTRSDIDTNHIGLLGHSEGAIAAFIAAVNSKDISFIISIGGPTIPGDSLILEQIKITMKNHNVPDSIFYHTIADQNKIYQIVRKNLDFQEIRKILMQHAIRELQIYPENIRSQIPEQLIERNIQQQMENMKTKWFRTFIDIDPMECISKLNCPVLFLFGGKDTQVPAEIMLLKLKDVVREKDKLFTIKVFFDANHLFQKAIQGSVAEYGILPKRFVPGFLEFIVDWLNIVVKRN